MRADTDRGAVFFIPVFFASIPTMVTSLSKETARISELIKQEQFGEVESVWAEALQKAPGEIDTFLTLAEKLYKAGHGERAGNLLEQVVSKLDSMGEKVKAVHVLGELARVAPRNANQKALADVVIAGAFSDLPGFSRILERAEQTAKGNDNRYVKALYDQLKFQPGDWVFHDAGWGLGQVKEIDAENDQLKVDFQNKENHAVKLGAAAKFFRKLPAEDIMVQRSAHLSELKQRCKDEPIAVVLGILKSHNNKSTLKRIKAELSPTVIDSKSWAKWWAGVRKDLAKHQYVKLGTGTNPTIERLVTAMTQEDETREQFNNAPKLEKKLEILRRYLRDSDKGETRADLLKYMGTEFKRLAEREGDLDARARDGTSLAGERIIVGFLRDDLRKADPAAAFDVSYDADELVRESSAMLERLEAIKDADYQQRALARHAKLNEGKWADTFAQAMLKDVQPLWDWIAKQLMENDHAKVLTAVLETVRDDGETYPLQTLWLVRRGITGGELPQSLELAPANELFARLLWVMNKVQTRIDRGDSAYKAVLANLRAAMTERNSRLLTTALDGLSDDRAAHLLHEVNRCRGLSDIHNSTLREVIFKSFPTLQAKTSLRAAELAEQEAGEILATQAGLRKREGELKRIQEEELPDVARQIGEALAMGDISENAELDAARERESRLKEAAKEIMEELKRVRVVTPDEFDASKAGFGTKVTLKREDGKTKVYTILGRYEADLERQIINNESPIAQGILGKKPGETAIVQTPEGAVKYEVISVERAE
ncbi:MAG: GreA/GreB family elongation factor [Planctomycetes bacterium]|nr:GreA/GreB family elongation factor [Planctomycetota bacterium]MCW8135489.1 GreA/GreB family elongation factor [Planctomycetota bacterium]